MGQSEPRYIVIKVKVPEEYFDVDDQLIFDDFIINPSVWKSGVIR